jgi:tRNA pseudouridine55 synthase
MQDGILVVDKPKDMTSHDVVNIMRKAFHTKKIGHTGTLDPDATGVLVLGINHGTKLMQYLTSDDKVYEAVLTFGADTDTQDAAGKIVAEKPLPKLTEEEFSQVLAAFLGKQMQVPPMYSAVKIKGKPLYKYARKGEKLADLPPRPIEIFDIALQSYDGKSARFTVHCSKGTYIRTLCQDIAHRAGTCGYMAALRRIRAGEYAIGLAHTVEEIRESDHPEAFLISMNDALHFPAVEIEEESTKFDIANGKRIVLSNDLEGMVKLVSEGHLLAIGTAEQGEFIPKKVFH